MEVRRPLFRDPVSGLTHLAGAVFGAVGLVYLLLLTRAGETSVIVAVTIYGVSLILLYAASATYHLLQVPDGTRAFLRRIDHAMVPVFIAGTYTPFCMLALKGALGVTVLVVVWILALAGLFKSIYWLHAPRWITAGLFVLMGWMIVGAAYPLSQAISSLALGLTFGGGVLYSLGAAIYAKKWPDPWPGIFGFHEVWHLFVLGGSACHYVAVLSLV